MEHYVTLFDSLFLPQGLALHISMERHIKGDYTLWILCVDDDTHEALGKLKPPNVRLLQLSKLETEDLLRVKSMRSKAEYCWTLTPFAPRFVFETDSSVQRVTYLDADLWFRNHPKPIFEELNESGKQVLITDHGYAPEYDQSATSGQYCVQFMTFNRSEAEVVRKWWENRCIEWCYARFEEGKFGDQKYLDEFPLRFDSLVHILNDKELALAPWNATRFPFGRSVFYHFHALRILSNNKVSIGQYKLTSNVISNIYEPYFKDLRAAIRQLESIRVAWRVQSGDVFLIRKIYRKMSLLRQIFRLNLPSGTAKW